MGNTDQGRDLSPHSKQPHGVAYSSLLTGNNVRVRVNLCLFLLKTWVSRQHVWVNKPIWAVYLQHFPHISSLEINLHLSVTLPMWTSIDHYTANSLSSSQRMLVNNSKRPESCHHFAVVVSYQRRWSVKDVNLKPFIPHTPIRLESIRDYKKNQRRSAALIRFFPLLFPCYIELFSNESDDDSLTGSW